MRLDPDSWLLPLLWMAAVTPGCGPAVQIDVECPKLCLAAAGPTLPGLASQQPLAVAGAVQDGAVQVPWALAPWALDAGAAASLPESAALRTSVTWSAVMRFNDVLGQLPSASIDASLDVRLGSIDVASTTGLSFVDSVRVLLSREAKVPGGGQPATVVADAGAGDREGLGGPACQTVGSGFLIATFDRANGGTSGTTIELSNLAGETNLFDCMKDAPALFSVVMGFQAGSYPDVDAPLTLSTCVAAQGRVSYP